MKGEKILLICVSGMPMPVSCTHTAILILSPSWSADLHRESLMCPWFCELRSVSQQIDEDLLDADRISDNKVVEFRQVVEQCNSLFHAGRYDDKAVHEDILERELLFTCLQLTGLDLRHIEYVADQGHDVGDTEDGPKSDIWDRPKSVIRAHHCLNFPA